MKTLNLAMLGLVTDASSRIKELLENKLNYPISWVSATDTNVDTVIINAKLLESANVQKFISNTAARVLCCYSDNYGKNLARKYSVFGMHVDEESDVIQRDFVNKLSEYFEQGVIGTRATNSTQKPHTVDIIKKDTHAAYAAVDYEETKNSTNDEKVSAVIASIAAKRAQAVVIDNTFVRESVIPTTVDFNLFMKKIKQPNICIYVVSGGKRTWIDTAKKIVWCDYDSCEVPDLKHIVWSEVVKVSPPDVAHCEDLDSWLFGALWATDFGNEIDELSEENYYKINRWIRPLNNSERTTIVRLAAFTQKSSISIDAICSKSGYSKNIVKHFLYSYLLIGWLSVESPSNERIEISTTKDKAVNTKTLSMLQRLRKKIFF